MLVTCQICKKKVDRDTAYKRTVKGRNLYYCSQEEYDYHEQEKVSKKKVYTLINDIFGYKVVHTMLFKEYQIWLSLADNTKIAAYIEENKAYIDSVMSKDFTSEFLKIRYFSAILKNNLRDFKVKIEEKPAPKIEVDETVYDFSYTPTPKKRRSLADLEDEI